MLFVLEKRYIQNFVSESSEAATCKTKMMIMVVVVVVVVAVVGGMLK